MNEMYASVQSLNQAQHLPPACGARQLSKLKRFLTTIQHYAADISPEVLQHTRELMLALVNQQFSVEEFHTKIQQGINLPMRPFIIPFLKTNLPLLQRELFYCSQMSRQSPHVFLPGNQQIESQSNLETEELINVSEITKTKSSVDQDEQKSEKILGDKDINDDLNPTSNSCLVGFSKKDLACQNTNTTNELNNEIVSNKFVFDISYYGNKFPENTKKIEDQYELNIDKKSKSAIYPEDMPSKMRALENDKEAIFKCLESNKLSAENDIYAQKITNTLNKNKNLSEEIKSEIKEKRCKNEEKEEDAGFPVNMDNIQEEYLEGNKEIKIQDEDELNKNEIKFIFPENIKNDDNQRKRLCDKYQHIQNLQKEIDLKLFELDRMQEDYNSRMKILNEQNTHMDYYQ